MSLNAVASVLRLNGDLVGAESLLQQSFELNRTTRGEYHANTGTSLHDLGIVAASRGDFVSAESRHTINLFSAVFGVDLPGRFSTR